MKDNKERQQEFKERMESNGYSKTPVWVPLDKKKLIRDIAKRMRDRHEQIYNK